MANSAGNGTVPARHATARRALEPGDRVAVTGSNGFIGSAITRALVARKLDVVALVEPNTPLGNLEALAVTTVEADVADARAIKEAVAGARVVFHVAAVYRF